MEERLQILELIEAGAISVAEGVRRLETTTETAAPPHPVSRPALARWLWRGALLLGAALVAWGGLLLISSYTGESSAGKLIWGWLIFIVGVMGVILSWWLQRARWLYVRVRQADGPNITIAFPLPLGLVAWGLRIARPFVPQLAEMRADELLLALRGEMRAGRPFTVEVDEEDEQVEIYFG